MTVRDMEQYEVGGDMTIRSEELPYTAFLECGCLACAMYAAFRTRLQFYRCVAGLDMEDIMVIVLAVFLIFAFTALPQACAHRCR